MIWRRGLALALAVALGGSAYAGPARRVRVEGSVPRVQKLRKGPPRAPIPALGPALASERSGQPQRPSWLAPRESSRKSFGTLESLRDIVRSAAPAEAGKAFDGAGRPDGELAAGEGPLLPVGVKRVSVDVVRTAADVDRLVPKRFSSKHLIDGLKEHVAEMAPYRIYTYHPADPEAASFVGIDLSANPRMIKILPAQESHEVRLIRKIQLWNKNLQVLVREEGATPDLIVGGMVTELKSRQGESMHLLDLLEKANSQVSEHAARHGLGHGAVAIDLTQEEKVPVDAVLGEIEGWRVIPVGAAVRPFSPERGAPGKKDKKRASPRLKTRIVLDRIFVFAGRGRKVDLKVFVRSGKGGPYRLEEPAGIPYAQPGKRVPGAREVRPTPEVLAKAKQVKIGEIRLEGLKGGRSRRHRLPRRLRPERSFQPPRR